jgi:hypothetical protein
MLSLVSRPFCEPLFFDLTLSFTLVECPSLW